MADFTHFNADGRARMVDVSEKQETQRTALAAGTVFVNAETFRLIETGGTAKGDVLATAQIAGRNHGNQAHIRSYPDVPSDSACPCGPAIYHERGKADGGNSLGSEERLGYGRGNGSAYGGFHCCTDNL